MSSRTWVSVRFAHPRRSGRIVCPSHPHRPWTARGATGEQLAKAIGAVGGNFVFGAVHLEGNKIGDVGAKARVRRRHIVTAGLWQTQSGSGAP